MDKETLLGALSGTLDANKQVRKHSEQQLAVFEQQPGFTAYLLDLMVEADVTLGIQISAAILFKNRVGHYWEQPESSKNASRYITEAEKPSIKTKLIETLLRTYTQSQLRSQLLDALYNILDHDKWDELVPIIRTLLADYSQHDHVFVGLLCLQKYTLQYRWVRFESKGSSNPILEEVASELFPKLEEILERAVADDDLRTNDDFIYMIVKTFKYATFSYLPEYLQDASHLGTWCRLQLLVINKPLPKAVLDEDDADQRAQYPRVKAVKWCFANLARLLHRHGQNQVNTNPLKPTTNPPSPFAEMFLTDFVPQILNEYWRVVESWAAGSLWLSAGALHHLVAFFAHVTTTVRWPLVFERLEAILEHVIMPLLVATRESIELYEDEPEEYARRYFDTYAETSRADLGAVDFVFRLVSHRSRESLATILQMVQRVLEQGAPSLDHAMRAEGALRVLLTVGHKLKSKYSPVNGAEDSFLHSTVYPFLVGETAATYPWLTARACDTIAMLAVLFRDERVLDDIFRAITTCIANEEQFPVQMAAVQALSTLIEEDVVSERIAEQVPQLMGFLLEMSKKYESDALTTIMETFVERFASNLEPFAAQLAVSLTEQFMALAQEMLDSDTVNVEKENKGSGIINTLTTLVMAMTSSPHVVSSLEAVVVDMVRCVLDNAVVSFLTDALELVELILYATRSVSPAMWLIFETCNSAFDTYAYEYMSSFQPFYEGIINYGFTSAQISIETPHVQQFFEMCFGVLKLDALDPLFASSALQMLELAILALSDRGRAALPRFLSELYDIYAHLEATGSFDGYMLHRLSVLKVFFAAFYVDPVATMGVVASKGFTAPFFTLWVKHADDFQSVYGCKLQILASLSLVSTQAVGALPEDLVGETINILMTTVAALPGAIKKKADLLAKDQSAFQVAAERAKNADSDDEGAYDEYEWDDEDDEAELEALEVTPIDETNVFQVLSNTVVAMQQQDTAKYEALFGGIEPEHAELLTQLINITRG